MTKNEKGNGRETVMAENEEEKKQEEKPEIDGPYYCPYAPNDRCVKGHEHGWRRSKECRICDGTGREDW